jgi:hypothetical protein
MSVDKALRALQALKLFEATGQVVKHALKRIVSEFLQVARWHNMVTGQSNSAYKLL